MAIHRGEIYFVNLNPANGREQAGERPVLVLSIDAINKLPLVITVVVGTSSKVLSRIINLAAIFKRARNNGNNEALPATDK